MLSILHTTTNTWAETASSFISERLSLSLAKHRQASLVVPGGRSATTILPLLAKKKLDWANIYVTLTDERWVQATHPDSNERLVRQTLTNSTKATFIGLKTMDAHPEDALARCTKRLMAVPRPFDVVFIGMGEDGHIASLFPGAPIEDGDFQAQICPDHPRISMTPSCLLNSKHVILAISGESKCNTLSQAKRPGPKSEFPVRHILHQDKTPVTVITD